MAFDGHETGDGDLLEAVSERRVERDCLGDSRHTVDRARPSG